MNLEHSVQEPTLSVRDLAISYTTRKEQVPAVRRVSFDIHRGEAYGIVGESGCGKSTIAFSVVNFLGRNGRITGGSVQFEGEELRGRSERALRRLRGNRIAMVYQDPMRSLNPSIRIGAQMAETLIFHQKLERSEAWERCVEMLKRVYMPDPEAIVQRYPHQLSGGQQQRVIIATALLNSPSLLIMDEPTTALDVTVEAAVLDLIDDLRHQYDTAIMYITHNLGVIARIADRAGVMYAGEIVEESSIEELFSQPLHPYTQGLLRCVPRVGRTKESSSLYPIRGLVPSPAHLPPGCVFAPRCDYARPECCEVHPELFEVGPDHWVRCPFTPEIARQPWQPSSDLLSVSEGGAATSACEPILEIRDVRSYYLQEGRGLAAALGLTARRFVKAVDGVSLNVPQCRTLGIVGESGCGKSTLARTIVGLERVHAGRLVFLGEDISGPLSRRSLDMIRELQMVFQNPDATMNPSYSVGYQIARPLRRFKTVPGAEVRNRVYRLLEAVRLNRDHFYRLPSQLSGGEKQRVGIARALAAQPSLVVCDEPVSALDVSVQAAVLNLLMEIQYAHGTTLLFIAHDLSTVHFFCDEIGVMYLGRMCEVGPAEDICAPPYHPYTEALLSAVPVLDPTVRQKRIRLGGTVPSALNPPPGCTFHTRCPRRNLLPDGGAICERELPPGQENGPHHRIYCHIPLDELRKVEPVLTVLAQ